LSATTPTAPTERIMNLEMAVAHLQHELEQMHAVLLALQTELKTARDQVSKLERRIVLVQEGEDNRNLDDERPPHY
jgi:SlyX protein